MRFFPTAWAPVAVRSIVHQWATTHATTKSATTSRGCGASGKRNAARWRPSAASTQPYPPKVMFGSGPKLQPLSHQNITGWLSVATVAAPLLIWICVLSRVTQKLPFGWRFVKCNARVATATAGRASLRWRDIRQFENTSLSGFRSKAGGKSKCMTKPLFLWLSAGIGGTSSAWFGQSVSRYSLVPQPQWTKVRSPLLQLAADSVMKKRSYVRILTLLTLGNVLPGKFVGQIVSFNTFRNLDHRNQLFERVSCS